MIWRETSRCGSWLGDDPAAARAASCGRLYPVAVLACGCPAGVEEAWGLLAGQTWADTSSEEPAGSGPLVGRPGDVSWPGPPRPELVAWLVMLQGCYVPMAACVGLAALRDRGLPGPRFRDRAEPSPVCPQEGWARQVAVQHAGAASAPEGRVPHSQPHLRPHPFHMPPSFP